MERADEHYYGVLRMCCDTRDCGPAHLTTSQQLLRVSSMTIEHLVRFATTVGQIAGLVPWLAYQVARTRLCCLV
jgi:hypothetical protein